MSRPKLLDLFCGAGGCSVGYYRAGFDVVGVDVEPHPDYPFPFIQGDALELLDRLILGGRVATYHYPSSHRGPTYTLADFAVIAASPPCPAYSIATQARGNQADHPRLIEPVRDALHAWGGAYVIENVPGAPLVIPLLICGRAMGMRHIKRHRLFESNLPLMSPGCLCPVGDTVSVFGHSGEDRRKATRAKHGSTRKHVPFSEVRELMGCDWMTSRDDVSDAIPPAYTEYIGAQLLEQIQAAA